MKTNTSISTKFVVRTDIINSYLNNINKIPSLSASEEQDLFAAYSAASTEDEKIAIRNKIIEGNQRYLFSLAKVYATDDTLSDLISVGNLGLIEGFNEYDPSLGYRFCTFAKHYVRRAIHSYLYKENIMVHSCNNVRVVPKVKKIENEYYMTYGRKPTADEVMDILFERYNIVVKDESDMYGTSVEYIDSSISDDDDFTMEDSVDFNERTCSENSYEETIEHDSLSDTMTEAMKTLTDRERLIINMFSGNGYSRALKDKEIAERIGITSERVRQVRHAAIAKLKDALAVIS